MTPEQLDDGTWVVVNDAGEQIAGQFDSEAEANNGFTVTAHVQRSRKLRAAVWP